MVFKFMEKGKSFATNIAIIFGILSPVDSFHVLVDVSGTEFLFAQLTFFCLGIWSQVPLNVVFEILNFVNSSIAERTFEPWNRVVYKGMLPISVDSRTGLVTNRTLT